MYRKRTVKCIINPPLWCFSVIHPPLHRLQPAPPPRAGGPLVPSLCLFQVPRWLVFICRRKMVRQEHSERAARREERRACVCECVCPEKGLQKDRCNRGEEHNWLVKG